MDQELMRRIVVQHLMSQHGTTLTSEIIQALALEIAAHLMEAKMEIEHD